MKSIKNSIFIITPLFYKLVYFFSVFNKNVIKYIYNFISFLFTHTTKRRTTNLKTKNNQNCQKIKLYGSPTTKELKKKHSSRPVGRAETVSQAERTHGKAMAGAQGSPTFACR